MTKADKIEAWLRDHVGCGYVMGATGWVCSPARRAQQARQYPQYADTIMGTCAKWDGKACFDCAQLVCKAAAQAGYKLPSGATSQWRADVWEDRGEAADAPSGRLICLFRDDGGTKQHVGWRLRNGDVIDARGSSAGVVLNKPYRAWTHWAILPNLDEETESGDNMIATVMGGRLALRQKPSKDATLIGWIPNGDRVNVLSFADEWSQVEHGGSTGYCMTKFLSTLPDAEQATGEVVYNKQQLLLLLCHAEENLAELRKVIESM